MYRQLRRMELRNAALPVEGGIDNIKVRLKLSLFY
jgi:hypothetical protein